MTQTIAVSLPSDVVYVTGTVNDGPVTWTNVGGEQWEAVADRSDDDIYAVKMTIVNAAGTSTAASFTLYYGLLNLITDRTQADVDYVARLARTGWANMTETEKTAWTSDLKGAYNASDLNRVGNAVRYVAGRLEEAGYIVGVSPRIDWAESDIPTESDLTAYLADVSAIRGVLDVPTEVPPVPGSMAELTYEEANDIERILLAVDDLITRMVNAYFYANEIHCGEV